MRPLDAGGGDRRRALGGAAGARGRGSPLAYQGPVAPEAVAAFAELADGGAGGGAAGDHVARTGCMPAGWRRMRARRAGTRGARVAYRADCWRRWRRARRW